MLKLIISRFMVILWYINISIGKSIEEGLEYDIAYLEFTMRFEYPLQRYQCSLMLYNQLVLIRLSFGFIFSNLFVLQEMLSNFLWNFSGCVRSISRATSLSPWVCPFLCAGQTIRIFTARASQVQINTTIVDITRESKSCTVRFGWSAFGSVRFGSR